MIHCEPNLVKLIYGINTDTMVECIKNNDLGTLSQLWNQRQAHAVVGVNVTKNKDGKTMLLGVCLTKLEFLKCCEIFGLLNFFQILELSIRTRDRSVRKSPRLSECLRSRVWKSLQIMLNSRPDFSNLPGPDRVRLRCCGPLIPGGYMMLPDIFSSN